MIKILKLFSKTPKRKKKLTLTINSSRNNTSFENFLFAVQ